MRTYLLVAAVLTAVIGSISAASTGAGSEADLASKLKTLEENFQATQQSLKDEITQLRNELHKDGSSASATQQQAKSGGVSYIRWGRTTCPSGSSMLYTGFAAGKKRESINAGSEYICLPKEPQWGDFDSTCSGSSSIVGVEYEFSNAPFSAENLGGKTLYNEDMPCTVCYVEKRSHQLMIPAMKNCPKGWTLEYWGYLVSSYWTVYGSPYMCLDGAPEAVEGSSINSNPQMVFAVESDCIGLPCPPYATGRELTCAVCSI